MSFDQWRQMGSQVAQDPADLEVLADMKARVDSKMARAEGQENTAKFDAILMAGLSMMGGTSLADGIARAAQTGGATFLAGKQKAAKAVDAAEDAELAFNKYRMELRKGDEKAAQSAFESYMGYTAKMAQIGVTERVGMARAKDANGFDAQDIDTAVSRDPRVTAAAAAVGKVLNPKDRPAAEDKLAKLMATVRKEKVREFSGVAVNPATSTPPTGNPMPTNKAQLAKGEIYNTARGPARWNGESFEPVQ